MLSLNCNHHLPVRAVGSSSNTPSSKTNIITPLKPNLKKLSNGHYQVLEDWPLTVSNRNFVVQKGYTSNGITAPQSIKTLLGDHINAPETWTAVFHDWCFTQNHLGRPECDSLYIQLMKDFKINPNKIALMGTTVRGYTVYKNR